MHQGGQQPAQLARNLVRAGTVEAAAALHAPHPDSSHPHLPVAPTPCIELGNNLQPHASRRAKACTFCAQLSAAVAVGAAAALHAPHFDSSHHICLSR